MGGPRRRPGEQIVVPRRAWDVAESAHQALRYAGEPVGPGLTRDEREGVERRFGFTFSPVHRAFLAIGLPRGPLWPNWRSGRVRSLREWVDGPVDGVVADVLEHDFWPARWGMRPARDDEREAVARAQLRRVPPLVPLHGARFMPSGVPSPACPVLSVRRTDVVVVGADLVGYVAHEHGGWTAPSPTEGRVRVPFWSDLAELFAPARRRPGIMSP